MYSILESQASHRTSHICVHSICLVQMICLYSLFRRYALLSAVSFRDHQLIALTKRIALKNLRNRSFVITHCIFRGNYSSNLLFQRWTRNMLTLVRRQVWMLHMLCSLLWPKPQFSIWMRVILFTCAKLLARRFGRSLLDIDAPKKPHAGYMRKTQNTMERQFDRAKHFLMRKPILTRTMWCVDWKYKCTNTAEIWVEYE